MIRNYDFDFEEDDIPRHVKKKEPSPKTKKSKHKHEYEDCLLIEEYTDRPYKGSYCIICGKIKDFGLFHGEDINLTNREILEKYKHLKKFYVEDMWQKYVILEEN